MMKRGKNVIRNYMTLEYDFTGIRIQYGSLIPVDWKLTANIIAQEKKGRSRADAEFKAGLTYQKLYFWLDTNLPNIIMVDVNKEEDLYIANLSSNIMMYCPSFANDDVIVQVIHSKLAALAGDELIIGEIHLKGSDTALQYTFDCPDGQYMLPETTAEYYTEGVARDVIPWWSRDDGFSFEFIRPKDSELSNEELFADIVDPLDEFYKAVTDSEETPITITKEPAKIVQVEKWKPRKVE